jgi:hypothetical protein
MLFTRLMSKTKIYLYSGLVLFVFIIWMFSDSGDKNEEFSESVKISLRDIGNQLLLANQDSTSLVLPVVALEKSKYKLSFQKQLSFDPGNLVSIVQHSFEKSSLSEYYRVEVIQCSDEEVAYSYEMNVEEETTIIACRGRVLPEDCYTIEVKFANRTASFSSKKTFMYILFFIGFVFLFDYLYQNSKKAKGIENSPNEVYASIGSFKFYPEQNKLVKKAIEISLSKKECELLSIFIANPNQIIKRDELTKKVWEDHGVFVSRSLDTYISKLRKKLKADDSIKLTNVHGVGYKLEIN